MGSKEGTMIFKVSDAVLGVEYEGGLGKQVKLTFWLRGQAPRERPASSSNSK